MLQEFRRKYNTCYFDGTECSQIVVMADEGWQVFQDDNFYHKKVETYGGQDFNVQFHKIKRGNRTLFKDGKMPQLKESRIIPQHSIPSDLTKGWMGNGDVLFIVPEAIRVEEMEDDVHPEYTTRDRQYHILFNGLTFIGKRFINFKSKEQALERVYNSLQGCNSDSYRETARVRMAKDKHIMDNMDRIVIAVSERSVHHHDTRVVLSLDGEELVNKHATCVKDAHALFRKFDPSFIVTPVPKQFQNYGVTDNGYTEY